MDYTYSLFYLLMASLFLCIYLQRKINLLEQDKRNLLFKLIHTNAAIKDLTSLLEIHNEHLSTRIETMDEGYIDDLEDIYSTMAEELACKIENDIDGKKEEKLLLSEGWVKPFTEPFPTAGKIKDRYGKTIHVS